MSDARLTAEITGLRWRLERAEAERDALEENYERYRDQMEDRYRRLQEMYKSHEEALANAGSLEAELRLHLAAVQEERDALRQHRDMLRGMYKSLESERDALRAEVLRLAGWMAHIARDKRADANSEPADGHAPNVRG